MSKLRQLTEDLMASCLHLGVIALVAMMVKDKLDHYHDAKVTQ